MLQIPVHDHCPGAVRLMEAGDHRAAEPARTLIPRPVEQANGKAGRPSHCPDDLLGAVRAVVDEKDLGRR